MTHLLYSSNEMFSSTQLVRQSKKIFDKLSTNEIEKAIILRDGKPNFMLLDFNSYEEIMKDYIELKNMQNNSSTKKIKVVEEDIIKFDEPKEEIVIIEEEIVEDIIQEDSISNEEIELQAALKRLDELDLDPILKSQAKEKLQKQTPTGEIKEFWN